MVAPGQFLERSVLVQVKPGHVLDGLWHRGTKQSIVILTPAPWEGGSMDHILGNELSFTLTQEGHSTLRFNYSGIGGSQGKRATHPTELVEDARAAIELNLENRPDKNAVLISIGSSDAVVLALAASSRIQNAIFIAPTLASEADIRKLRIPFHVVWPEFESTENWNVLGPHATMIANTNKTFHRNLPHVGHAVLSFLGQ
jgi:uncharacterized protein